MVIEFLLNFSALSSLLIGIFISTLVPPSLSESPSLSPYESSTYSRRSFKRAQYGAQCNTTVKCDIHSLLHCEDNSCQCLFPDAMTYSVELGTCVSLVSEICGFLETKKVLITCVPNSLCDQHQGTCRCIQGYVELERVCVQQKGFGGSCHSDSECLSDLSLVCFEETCQCDPERYVPLYSGQEVKCVALAGQPCTAKTGCVPKASCIREGETDGRAAGSSTYGWMHPGICQCDSGYESDLNGYCRGDYGSNCDVLANLTCTERFHCLDGTCNCKYPDEQAYQESTGVCVGLVGGPCSDSSSEGNETEVLSIPSPASCGQLMECQRGSCVCKHGFVENLERGCDLTHGQSCAGQTMSKCDKAAGLYCLNGRCACKDDMRSFDGVVGKCVGKVGSSCSLPLSEDECRRLKQQPGVIRTNGDVVCDNNSICQVSRSQLRGLTARGVCMPNQPNVEEETEGLLKYL